MDVESIIHENGRHNEIKVQDGGFDDVQSITASKYTRHSNTVVKEPHKDLC
mgnify:CR=1 FL=1